MTNKPITLEEMKAYVGATWEKCQAEAWQEPRQWQGLTEEEIARRKKVKPILVRIMQEAYDLADRGDSEGYNSVKVMCSDVLAMINKLLDERQWQGLTDDEKRSLVEWAHPDIIDAIELRLRERNT